MQCRLKEITEVEPHSGADQRSEQGAGAADRSLLQATVAVGFTREPGLVCRRIAGTLFR